MTKKIYDIVPGNVECEAEEIKPVKKKRKRFPLPFFITFLIVIIIVLAGAYFIFPGKAEIQINPKIDELVSEIDVTVNSNVSLIDYDNNAIPGIIFSGDANKVYSEDYSSTGSLDNVAKATGTIRVFNKMSKPVSLIKNTGFLSYPGELIYRADSAFTIPAAKTDGTPGSVDIKVTASEAGTRYNISSSTTFSVPKLSGTEYYVNISAETITSKPISGGEESVIKVVSKDDLTSSKEAFQNKYINEAKQALIDSIPQGYEYFSDDIVPKVNNLTVDAKQGDTVDKFNISAKISSSILVFRKDDLNKLGESLIEKNVPDNKTLVPGSVSYDIKSKSTENGKIIMTVSFKGNVYSAPNEDFLIDSVRGKSKDYSISILKSTPEIEKVDINLYPFWQINVPDDPNMIRITLNLRK